MNDINLLKMDLNLLKSLNALMEEKHVGRAASRMNVTQSAMSHTLARLRDTFDDPLFTRSAKGLAPTSRMLEISEKLRLVLQEINSLLAPKTLDLARVKASFTIQTHEFIVTPYLAKAIKSIHQEAPNITLDIRLIGTKAYEKLEQGQLDMIIGTSDTEKPRFIQEPLLNEALVCLLDKTNPVLKHWSAEAIFSCPHISSRMLDDRFDPVSQYGKSHNLPQRTIGLYTHSLNLQPALLPGTNWIAFLPRSLAQQGCKQYGLTMKECPFTLPELAIRAVWHERHQNDLLHEWVRGKIAETAR